MEGEFVLLLRGEISSNLWLDYNAVWIECWAQGVSVDLRRCSVVLMAVRKEYINKYLPPVRTKKGLSETWNTTPPSASLFTSRVS